LDFKGDISVSEMGVRSLFIINQNPYYYDFSFKNCNSFIGAQSQTKGNARSKGYFKYGKEE